MFTSDVNFKRPHHLSFAALIALAAALLITSCKENISTIGSPFLQDSVFRGANTFSDSANIRLYAVLKQTVSAEGIAYNVNYSSPYLFLGNAPSENMSAWIGMKIPFIPDSTGTIVDDSLVISLDSSYFYGTNPGAALIEFDVYTCDHFSDSTASLTMADLSAVPVAHFSQTIVKDSQQVLVMRLDTSKIISALRTASLSLILVPTNNMTAIRGFASLENGSASLSPYIKLTISSTSGNYFTSRAPQYDFHLLADKSTLAQGEFGLRGSRALRERIVINTKQIRTQLGLTPFVTINSAQLEFVSDPIEHTSSLLPVDTSIPALVYRDSLTADSIQAIIPGSSRSATDVNTLIYQIRGDIEYAVRNGLDSIVFELQNGYAARTFGTTYIIVEDYNVDRWAFYDQHAADPTKRPKLLLTYSYLK